MYLIRSNKDKTRYKSLEMLNLLKYLFAVKSLRKSKYVGIFKFLMRVLKFAVCDI